MASVMPATWWFRQVEWFTSTPGLVISTTTSPHAGGFLVALQDKSGTGKADVIERFGETLQTGGAGGTGIGMYKGSIYAEINDRIDRYSLPAGSIVPNGLRKPSCPDCLLAATIPCTRS